MANVFLAIPHYREMPEAEIQRIKSELKMDGWEPYLKKGFHPAFDQSIQNLVTYSKHKFLYSTITGDGNLPRARSNHCGIWKLRYETDFRADYFLTLDDDISFSPDAIDLLIEDDKPVIGGVYRIRSEDPYYEDKVASRFWEDEPVYYDKPFKIKYLNGGFILSKAEVLFKMMDFYPELEVDVFPKPSNPSTKLSVLWLPMIYERQQLFEDWAFCQRARDAGFEIWADLRAKIVHWNAEIGYGLYIPIEGWTSEKELVWLREKSGEMESVTELGSWKGRSTYELLMGCKGKVYAVDHFNGDPDSRRQSADSGEKVFREFLRNVGHFPNLTLLKMDSVEAASSVDSVDMTFIDTMHTYEQLTKEINVWLPKTKRLICGHDYSCEYPGVMKAVQEKFGKVETFETIWFKQL